MYHVGSLVLALAAIPAWIFVIEYGLRLRRLRRSQEAYHILAFTFVVALVTTEELVMQRLMGGWSGHDAFMAVVVFLGAVLMWQRVGILWATRKRKRKESHEAR